MKAVQKHQIGILTERVLERTEYFARGVYEKQYNSPTWNLIKEMFVVAEEVLQEEENDG